MNSFLLFCKEYRQPYAIYFKGKNNSEITSLLGKAWQSLPQEKKREYEEAAKLDKSHRKTKTRSSETATMQFQFKVNKPIQKRSPARVPTKGPIFVRDDLSIYTISDAETNDLLSMLNSDNNWPDIYISRLNYISISNT